MKLFFIVLFTGIQIHTIAQFITIKNNQFVINNNSSCPIYFNGANTPWFTWNDFDGAQSWQYFDYNTWKTEFENMKNHGLNSTRIWISCDGDGQPYINSSGIASNPSAEFWKNCDSLFSLAKQNGIYVMATMFSFDHTKSSKPNNTNWQKMLTSETNIQTYVTNFIKPFVARYKSNPYLFAIDICNEPEWMVVDQSWGCTWAIVQKYVAIIAAGIKSEQRTDGSSVLVTVGSAATKWNSSKMRTSANGSGWGNNPDGNKWTDAALKAQYNNTNATLDFYSPHYYGWVNEWYHNPFEKTPTNFAIDDKPCLIGEMPSEKSTNISTPTMTLLNAFNALKNNGWQGHFPWTSNTVIDNNFGGLSYWGSSALTFKTTNSNLIVPNCIPTPPTCTISSPLSNQTFTPGTTITITANATSFVGTSITKVEFYNGSTLLYTDNSSPYMYSWANVPAGTYSITAKAYNNNGEFGNSSEVILYVQIPNSNILTNGEFDNNTSTWSIENNSEANGSMTIVTNAAMSGTNALKICQTNAGTEDWHIQVPTSISCIANKDYEISFIAKADAPRTIKCVIQQGIEPWDMYYSDGMTNLTTSNQTFTYNFTPTVSDNSAHLKFLIGGNTSCVYIDKVVFKEKQAPTKQIIQLSSGWNLISLYVIPKHFEIDSVFLPIIHEVDIIKNSNGFYSTSQNSNQSLTTLSLESSYLIKMKTAQLLEIQGELPTATTINLDSGWNMIGYPKYVESETTQIFSEIWNEIETIKNFDDFLDKSSGTLHLMIPNQGYYIYCKTPTSITFSN
ncbi:MAG TPA: Ig-like domain-containing protein [Bacteroidales bacterium]|nr:Ig-like domain-containing protein [Bacteroidales bacterium]